MFEYLKSHKFKIIIAILAVLLGMLIYSASVNGISNIPRNMLSIIVTPFQKAGAFLSEKTGNFFDTFLNASNNKKENEALKSEIDELNKKLIDYETFKKENEQLKDVTKVKETNKDFEVVISFVTSRDPADRYASFIIDKGTLHGVSINDPVITSRGLIGVVSEVSQISARVVTILSPELSVSTFENQSGELGVISGDVKYSEEGLCKLSILSKETKIKANDLIVTAGSTGKFPRGLPIGKINQVFDEKHGITKFATITPMDDIKNVSDVQVITNFLGQGSKLVDYLNNK